MAFNRLDGRCWHCGGTRRSHSQMIKNKINMPHKFETEKKNRSKRKA